MTHPWRIYITCVFSTLLVGCFSIRYKPVKLDSPPPLVAMTMGRCPGRLDVPTSCAVLVQAKEWTSHTGIHVEAGETYCIKVPSNQVWFDEKRRNIPPKGEPDDWPMNLAQKRHPDAGFFSLIVNTLTDVDRVLGDGHSVEKNDRYQTKSSGEIVFYANDAVGSLADPSYFYNNNSGQIWVLVQRCIIK